MTIRRFIITCLALGVAGIYLFVTAPPPVGATGGREAAVSATALFDTLQAVNAAARKVWTRDIVAAGKDAGFRFSERWLEEDAGPLPALFLRETAKRMQTHRVPAILFLGSDYPINPANRFDAAQKKFMQGIRQHGKAAYFQSGAFWVAMYPDRAVSQACVSCHNAHPSSPKKDWRLNDIMGAVTWMYPQKETITLGEVWRQVAILETAIGASYQKYLSHAQKFASPPEIGACWPDGERYCLPDRETFMRRVRQTWSGKVIALMETSALAMKEKRQGGNRS